MPLVSSKESLQPGACWRDKERPQGVIGLGGEELHHSRHALALAIDLPERRSTKEECTQYTKVVRFD
jgi:hypothetical protein